MMADKPIIFSGPMIRALLDGRKTQTRRVLKPQPDIGRDFVGIYAPGLSAVFECANPIETRGDQSIRLPYKIGQRLWVREAWSGEHFLADVKPSERLLVGHPSRLVSMIPETWYWADGSPDCGDWEKPRPSIHMPRWASRLTLTVTDVRVQRLQDISADDATAEGCPGWYSPAHPDQGVTDGQASVEEFADLWNSLHGPDAWDENPWVVALTFDVHRCNIDQMEAD